jgi:OPT family oligopeptide transporter
VSLLIPMVYLLPAGFIFAMTGSVIGTNLIAELVAGYALPGNPIANQIFKAYSLQTLSSSLGFIQDLKLGHYMKIPPRHTFFAQVFFSFWVALVQIGVQEFAFGTIPNLCSEDQEHRFTCPYARVFFTASIVWGIIGPARLFGEGGFYSPLYWALLIGAFLPIPFWFLARRYPNSWVHFISVPIALNGITNVPPASGIVYTAWFAVAFVFQYLIRKFNFRWWSKYNFVTSAGLDSGTVLSTIFIFLCLQLPDNGNLAVNWWGNNVLGTNLDGNPTSWLTPPTDGFAPAPINNR